MPEFLFDERTKDFFDFLAKYSGEYVVQRSTLVSMNDANMNLRNLCIHEDFSSPSEIFDVYIGADQEDKILPRAKEIMDTGIQAKDAIHAACAIEAGCDYLITADKRFSGLRSSEIKVINPVDFVRLEEGK